jgi:pimeloyl-ACP methyl ester carboxylesterase
MRHLAVLLSLLGALAVAAPAAAAPDPSPRGANDWTCKPSATHPEPVVLLHGLGATMGANWSAMSPTLKARGLCVFALTYGRDPRYVNAFYEPGGVLPIEQSSLEVQAFVRRVLETTGATEVDIVGHSEGTVQAGYLARQPGFADLIRRMVLLTPLWDGTNLAGVGLLYAAGRPFGLSQTAAALVARVCGSCAQFVQGSPFMESLAAGGVSVPGVHYTNIVTRYDELVVPYTSGILREAGASNIVLQQVCALDFSEHAWVAFDPIVHQLVLNVLHPPSARAPACRLVLPGLP